MFSRSPLQALALLTCSSPGKARPERGCPEAGAPGLARERGSLASRGQLDLAGEKRTGCRVEGAPASARCEHRRARSRVGASPCLAPRLCGSEVQLSLFSVRLGRLGSCFFLFLEDWADPAQGEGHQAVAIVFHYLKIGGKRG